jgi:hypothetical protein
MASVILGLVLALGSNLAGPGHVHAAPGHEHEKTGGLHSDHVHAGSDHGTHPTDSGSDLELANDHEGDDAVALEWVGSEATPKRAISYLATSASSNELSETPGAGNHDRPRAQPRDPIPAARPPSRAPPA